MKNPVNLTLLAIKVAMVEKLNKSIDADKAILKQYDKNEYKTAYLNIVIREKTRTSYTDETKAILNEIIRKHDLPLKTTNYKECTITTTNKADAIAKKAYTFLKNNPNKDIAKIATIE